MLFYLLQVILLQFVFLLFYYWFLRKETFFQWNRIYLIATSLLSFIIPLLRLGWMTRNQEWTERLEPVIIGSNNLKTSLQQQVEMNYNQPLLWIYVTGLVFFTMLFLVKLYKIFSLIQKHKTIKKSGYTMVLLSGEKEVFSFLHYIFIDEQLFRNKDLPIIKHELVHLKEKHWLDLLFFELLKIVFWFNPLLWLYQREMQLLHEFIADKTVLRNRSLTDYFNQILQETFQVRKVSFVNQFYQPKLLKKRIMMQKRNPSKHGAKIKYVAFAFILFGLMSLVDACKNEALSDTENIITADELKNMDAENIASINVTKNPDKIIIKTKNGEEKVYYPTKEDPVVNRLDKKINNNADDDDEEKAFRYVEVPPVYKGCEGLQGQEAKDCFSKKIQKFIAKNFRTDLADGLKLKGQEVKILTMFTFDKEGKVTNIKARSKYDILADEAKRVIALLPQVTPGQQDSKPVKVTYTLPIIFKVEK